MSKISYEQLIVNLCDGMNDKDCIKIIEFLISIIENKNSLFKIEKIIKDVCDMERLPTF